MGDKVQDRKRDGGRFLHPCEPNKRPLPVILEDRLVLLDGIIGDEAHALVLAFVGTRPPGEAKKKGNVALGIFVFEEVQAGRNAVLKELGPVPC
jgi:hypothetical protein